jgi:3',5'-cyclic AMP phosphodiesterase CpdA
MTNIIHLSDLHFGQNRFPYDLDMLKDCLSNFLAKFEKPKILITGDITFQAKPDGYQQATNFFNHFIEAKLIDRKDILSCPGNHDITRGIEPFLNYDKFAYSIRKDKLNSFSNNHYQILNVDDIQVVLLNSAYHTDHQYGLIDDSFFKEGGVDPDKFTIIAVHHHFVGQFEADVSTIRNSYPALYFFDKIGVNLVVHGHQHCNQSLPIGNSGFNISGVRSMGFLTGTYQNGINHICIENNESIVTPYHFSPDHDPNKITLVKVK